MNTEDMIKHFKYETKRGEVLTIATNGEQDTGWDPISEETYNKLNQEIVDRVNKGYGHRGG